MRLIPRSLKSEKDELNEKSRRLRPHSEDWFKSVSGGYGLKSLIFSLGLRDCFYWAISGLTKSLKQLGKVNLKPTNTSEKSPKRLARCLRASLNRKSIKYWQSFLRAMRIGQSKEQISYLRCYSDKNAKTRMAISIYMRIRKLSLRFDYCLIPIATMKISLLPNCLNSESFQAAQAAAHVQEAKP